MGETTSNYRSHRFPPLIVSHAVWLCYRFSLSLSFRDVEDLLAERGIIFSYEAMHSFEPTSMARYAQNHFSPVFTNNYWTSKESGYHFRCVARDDDGLIETGLIGRRTWGRRKNLYKRNVEIALGRELETPSSATAVPGHASVLA